MTLQELKRPKVHVFIGGSEHSRFKRARNNRRVSDEILGQTVSARMTKHWQNNLRESG